MLYTVIIFNLSLCDYRGVTYVIVWSGLCIENSRLDHARCGYLSLLT